MKKFHNQKLTGELKSSLRLAKVITDTQTGVTVHCPYCRHFIAKFFSDTKGHIQLKCNKCKEEIVLNTLDIKNLSRK